MHRNLKLKGALGMATSKKGQTATPEAFSTLDENLFFPRLGAHLLNIVPVDQILIYLVRNGTTARLISRGAKPSRRKPVFEKVEGIVGHLVRTRGPYFCNNTDRDPLFSARKGSTYPARAELAVPLIHEGAVVATIHFQCAKSEHKFSKSDIAKVEKSLNGLELPLSNMKMFLAAKNANARLLEKIEEKEWEIQKKDGKFNMKNNYKIREKEVIVKSEAMKKILKIADKVATTDVNCLITGERGVGKEMIARRIHCRSARSNRAFVSIDCSAFEEKFLEREIFGEELGSINNPEGIKKGLLEIAHGGTLFLNSVDCLGSALQSKLNSYLNENMTFRSGGHHPYHSDVRILAASNLDLSELSSKNEFREDLLFSLNTMILRIPSLRERLEDIETLAVHFLNSDRPEKEQKFLSASVVKTLESYSWPGNVRELQSAMERAYILSDGVVVEDEHISDHIGTAKAEDTAASSAETDFSAVTLDELEKQHICRALEHLGGNKTQTAKMLGITVKTLYNKLHCYGMIESKDNMSMPV